MAKHSSAHPGFQTIQGRIASRQGISKKAAGRILGKAKAEASAKARRKNPRLNRTGGKKRK